MNQTTHDCADQIKRANAEALALADDARRRLDLAIGKALECGQLMRERKEELAREGQGWIEWLETQCPGIGEQAARRHMLLAKRAPGPDDASGPSAARQAILAAGVLGLKPKQKAKRKPSAERGWVEFVKPLDRFRLWFNTRSDGQPMEEWGEDALRLLGNELQWFVNLHAEIQRVRLGLAKGGGSRQARVSRAAGGAAT